MSELQNATQTPQKQTGSVDEIHFPDISGKKLIVLVEERDS